MEMSRNGDGRVSVQSNIHSETCRLHNTKAPRTVKWQGRSVTVETFQELTVNTTTSRS